jgi:L-seryl-tRNA(Ser) seleniumtransferase
MGPQNTGILCGRKDLIESAFRQSCPHHAVGRPLKVSKEALVACITALRRYSSLNHESLLKKREERVKYWIDTLDKIPHIKVERTYPNPEKDEYFAQGWPRARITLDKKTGYTAEKVIEVLKEGNPAIYVGIQKDSTKEVIILNPHCIQDGEEIIVAERLKEIFKS